MNRRKFISGLLALPLVKILPFNRQPKADVVVYRLGTFERDYSKEACTNARLNELANGYFYKYTFVNGRGELMG